MLLFTEPCGQLFCLDTGIQQVRAEAGNIRVLLQFSISQDADIRGTVEQGGVGGVWMASRNWRELSGYTPSAVMSQRPYSWLWV